MVYFLDSSAAVKRYVKETGTGWIKGITNPLAGNRIHIVQITGVEVVSGLTRRMKGNTMTIIAGSGAIAEFRQHIAAEYLAHEVTPALIASAMRLAETHALRGYDAVQLAAALELKIDCLALGIPAPTLISADGELNAAAVVEGLSIDDPNTHP